MRENRDQQVFLTTIGFAVRQAMNAIPENDPVRGRLRIDIDRLRRRARLLSSGIYAAIISGVCAAVLLAIVFASEFMGLKYAYGVGLMFIVATIFLGVGLLRFAQEAQIGLVEADEYE